MEKFDIFAKGELSETYERFIVNKRDKSECETFDINLAGVTIVSGRRDVAAKSPEDLTLSPFKKVRSTSVDEKLWNNCLIA